MARPASTLGRPATGLPRYYMDCAWWRGPKWAGVDPDALFVHSAAVSYCTQHGTDGRMPADLEDLSLALGVKLSVVRKAIKSLLAEAGDGRRRWARVGTEFEIVGWIDHNPVAAEVAEHSERQRSRGSLGNHRRWHQRRGVVDPDCAYCDSPSDDRLAISPEGSHPPSPQATSSPGESHGMGWDGMGTDDSQPPDNSRPPATTPAGRPDSAPPPPAQDQNALLSAAATLLAKAETDRRQALGELDRPDGYKRSRIAPIRREHEDFWRQLLAETPSLSAQELADATLGRWDWSPAGNGTHQPHAVTTTTDGTPFIFGTGRATGPTQLPTDLDPDPTGAIRAAARRAQQHPHANGATEEP